MKKEDRRKKERRSKKIKVDLNKRRRERRWQGERRESPRYETQIWIGPGEGDYLENPKKGTISLEGCDFLDTIRYGENEIVSIKFELPQIKRTFHLKGRIVESRKISEGYLTRVVFVDMALKDELGLARFFDLLL